MLVKVRSDHALLINISPAIGLGVTHADHHRNHLTLPSQRCVYYSAGRAGASTILKGMICENLSQGQRNANDVSVVNEAAKEI